MSWLQSHLILFRFPVFAALTHATALFGELYIYIGRAHHFAPQGHSKRGLASCRAAIVPIQTDAPSPRSITEVSWVSNTSIAYVHSKQNDTISV